MKMEESGAAKKGPTHIPPMFMDLSAQLPVQLSPSQLKSAMEQKHISKDIQVSKDWNIYASLHFPIFFSFTWNGKSVSEKSGLID